MKNEHKKILKSILLSSLALIGTASVGTTVVPVSASTKKESDDERSEVSETLSRGVLSSYVGSPIDVTAHQSHSSHSSHSSHQSHQSSIHDSHTSHTSHASSSPESPNYTVSSFSMSEKTKTVYTGSIVKITINIVYIVYNTAVDIIWTSSNPSVATVDKDGYVHSLTPGTTTITAKVNDGSGLSDSCVFTVEAETKIDSVTEDNEESKVYDLSGNIVPADSKGVKILKSTDGKAKKVLIK